KEIVRRILSYHPNAQTLIIGLYVEQLRELADELGGPLLTGTTRQARRDELFAQFKAGTIRLLAVSKVANFAVDLPDASVAIQILRDLRLAPGRSPAAGAHSAPEAG